MLNMEEYTRHKNYLKICMMQVQFHGLQRLEGIQFMAIEKILLKYFI